jgi:hypothetical protein
VARTATRKSTRKKASDRPSPAAGNGAAADLLAAMEAQLGATQPLPAFLAKTGALNLAERQQVVDQALVLIEQVYVHLPLKRAMHAVDPVQRLKLLRHRVEMLSERQFHDELLAIFTELRDLHTNYVLPAAYQNRTAFLPFLLEEFFESNQPRYMVSKTFAGFSHATFQPGVIVEYWNGIPIARAVELNAARQAGSNRDARHARGLESLTIRALWLTAAPDEEWVDIGYHDGTQAREIRIDWRVFSPDPSPTGIDPDSAPGTIGYGLGIDVQLEAVRRVKKMLFNQKAMDLEHQVETLRAQGALTGDGVVDGVDLTKESTMPDALSFRTVETSHGTFGLIRIWTFNVGDPDAFVQEFIRILGLLPQNGLIVDVRGNGGGVITAGEQLLQLLTPRAIDPERLHFINTPLTLALSERNTFINQWAKSIKQAVETGATFSQGFPIAPVAEYNQLGQSYCGPVVLVTDALCYSTTDIFAAGFQDHAIGPILGTDGNTGAGGANVWTHGLLRQALPATGSPFRATPKGVSFRVAIRRTTRVGERSGEPLEDLGVVPDQVHLVTKDDLMNGNVDLIEAAAGLLAQMTARSLTASVTSVAADTIQLAATTANISRLDITVDGRPRLTIDTADGEHTFDVPAPSAGGNLVELRGFDNDELVAVTRVTS